MRYKFEVTYMPAPLMPADGSISEFDKTFSNLPRKETQVISCKKHKSADEIKRNIAYNLEQAKCKVISIEGGIVG